MVFLCVRIASQSVFPAILGEERGHRTIHLVGLADRAAEISISYPDSKVTSFDMNSLAFACAAAAQQGLVVAALECKILFTGTKVSGDTVTFDATFKPDGFLDIGGISLFKVKMKEVFFPSRFAGLESFTFTVLELQPGALVQVAFDSVKYTARVRE